VNALKFAEDDRINYHFEYLAACQGTNKPT